MKLVLDLIKIIVSRVKKGPKELSILSIRLVMLWEVIWMILIQIILLQFNVMICVILVKIQEINVCPVIQMITLFIMANVFVKMDLL